MKFIKQLLGLTLSLASVGGFAGNGSGGGGVVFGDQINPWFLSNTPVVNYCIQIDPRFSTLSQARVEQIVAESLGFWKNQFSQHDTDFSPNVGIGTKVYLFSSTCSKSTDLVFQLGFLTEAQKKEIPGHKQLLGLAYRTEYDPEQLRGKGFIYIAAEQDVDRPRSSGMHDTPWSVKNGMALKWALVHEVGHIYGMQDDHYADDTMIMAASFVENVASQLWIDFGVAENGGFGHNVLTCDQGYWESVGLQLSHSVSKESQEILGLEDGSVNFRLVGNGNAIALHEETERGMQLAGTLHYEPFYSSKMSSFEMIPLIRLWVDEKQKVLETWDQEFYGRYNTVFYGLVGMVVENARYVTRDGKTTPVFVKVGRGCMPTIGTITGTKIIFDLLTPVSGSKAKK